MESEKSGYQKLKEENLTLKAKFKELEMSINGKNDAQIIEVPELFMKEFEDYRKVHYRDWKYDEAFDQTLFDFVGDIPDIDVVFTYGNKKIDLEIMASEYDLIKYLGDGDLSKGPEKIAVFHKKYGMEMRE